MVLNRDILSRGYYHIHALYLQKPRQDIPVKELGRVKSTLELSIDA
jgi:hypothetical protein